MATERREYTSRSFDSVLQKIKDYIQASFPLAANDFFEDHILMVTAQLQAYVADQLHFYLDMSFNEVMWDTVGQRENIVRLAKLLGYEPRGISSAQATLQCVTDAYTPDTLIIAKGTKITASAYKMDFEVSQDYAFTSPASFEVNVIEGTTRVDEFLSDGTTDQVVYSQYDSVSSSVAPIVEVGSGATWTTWTKVDFLFSVTTGNYYELSYVEDSRLKIVFGDGVHGDVPGNGKTVRVTYLTSNGISGNVPALAIRGTINGTVGGSPHEVTVSNSEASSGGDAEEGVEEIRVNAPIYFQSLGSLVTATDFKGFCERYAGVAKAKVALDETMKDVHLYLMGDGYTQTNQALKDALRLAIEEVRLMGVVYSIEDVAFPTVNVTAEIYVEPNYSMGQVQDACDAAIQEYFRPADPNLTERDIGENLHFSDVDRLLDEVSGVKYLKLKRFARVPVANLVSWTGDTYFDAIQIGVPSVNETWTITFTSPTQFQVVGSVSGLQGTTGTVDTPFETDGAVPALSFIIRSDSTPNATGDYATILVSEYAGDVVLQLNEFPLEGTISFTYFYA